LIFVGGGKEQIWGAPSTRGWFVSGN